MTAVILPFVRRALLPPPAAHAAARLPEAFARDWAARHLPLVAAAVDMLQVDDHELGRRCAAIADEPGALDQLSAQLTRLATYLRDISDGMFMVVRRMQDSGAVLRGQPA